MIDQKIVIKEFLSIIVCIKAQIICIYKLKEVVIVCRRIAYSSQLFSYYQQVLKTLMIVISSLL